MVTDVVMVFDLFVWCCRRFCDQLSAMTGCVYAGVKVRGSPTSSEIRACSTRGIQ